MHVPYWNRYHPKSNSYRSNTDYPLLLAFPLCWGSSRDEPLPLELSLSVTKLEESVGSALLRPIGGIGTQWCNLFKNLTGDLCADDIGYYPTLIHHRVISSTSLVMDVSLTPG